MKKFSFRLDRVARVRQIERERAEAEHARARAEEAAVQARIRRLREQAAAEANGIAVGNVSSVVDVRATAFRASLRARAAEIAMVDLAQASQVTAERAEALLVATRKVDALGKLEGRHREHWAAEARREEAAFLDDIATTRAARAPEGELR